MSSLPPDRDRTRVARFGCILAVAAAPRIWAAVWDQGIFWPDEIFQSTEQAHRFAFGYGFVSWEFQDGARSWLFPGALGLFWKLLAGLGVSGAPALVISAKLLMVALALGGIYASMRLAEKLGGAEAAVLCGVLAAVFPPSIVYGSRCMTEMASGPLCVAAALLCIDSDRWKLMLAGGLAALAIYLRYQNGIVAIGLLVWLLAQRRQGDALAYLCGAVVIGVAGGLLDLFTWGSPFHSFFTYVRFNLLEGRSANFGVEPFAYYFVVFWSAVGVSVVAIIVGLCGCRGRALGLLTVVLFYIAAHTLIAHKELRFMMPIVPLTLALSGVGLAALMGRLLANPEGDPAATPTRTRRVRRRHAPGRNPGRPESPEPGRVMFQVRKPIWVIVAVLAVAMGWKTANASFDDFGQRHAPLAGKQPLWHRVEAVNRLLWAAGQQPDLCGLALVAYGPIWTGGYTYLHRDVPILWEEPIQAEMANYVLAPAQFQIPKDYATVATIGEAQLARRAGTCTPAPESYTRLFPK